MKSKIPAKQASIGLRTEFEKENAVRATNAVS
jgi:hypothetical protein